MTKYDFFYIDILSIIMYSRFEITKNRKDRLHLVS